MFEKRHLSDEEEAIQKKNDPGRGGWGDISLLPAETAGFVPSPTFGSRYSTTILVTVVVGLILLSVIMMIMASVSKPATKLMAMDISHTLTMAICCMTAIYISTVVMMVTYVDVSASDSTCTATYVTAAVFWVLVKTLLHLWFNEKLYIRRYMRELESRRWNRWYKINTIGLALPFLCLVWVVSRYPHSDIHNPECRVGVDHREVLFFLEFYLIILNVYMCLHFLADIPRLDLSRLPLSVLLKPKAPRFTVPVRTGTVDDAQQRYEAIIFRKRMKSERNKGLYLCFLSALTGMAPIVVVTTMIFVGEGSEDGRWWYWVSMIVADLVLASVVVGFHEGRPFAGWDAESRNEVQKMVFRANMMGMCLECGYQDDTSRWGWRNPSI